MKVKVFGLFSTMKAKLFKDTLYWPSKSEKKIYLFLKQIFSRGLCQISDKSIPKIVNNLNMFLSAPYDCQKISTTAFYAEVKII